MAMPTIRVKDIEMYYESHGKGTSLIHIGGLAGDARAWTRQIEHLSKHYQVICFDNRGTGRTSCPDMPYSTKLFAEDTVGLMDALGIDRAHSYGISMGGCIAQEIAINYPKRVLTLHWQNLFTPRFGVDPGSAAASRPPMNQLKTDLKI
jgi:3-oxoadipate enol-lactonase